MVESVGVLAEPFLLPLLSIVLERLADKQAPVREAATAAVNAFFAKLCPYSVEVALPTLFDGLAQVRQWGKVGWFTCLCIRLGRACRGWVAEWIEPCHGWQTRC